MGMLYLLEMQVGSNSVALQLSLEAHFLMISTNSLFSPPNDAKFRPRRLPGN